MKTPVSDMAESMTENNPAYSRGTDDRVAGNVVQGPFKGAAGLPGALGQIQNSQAAKAGGVGYSPVNISFDLLKKMGK